MKILTDRQFEFVKSLTPEQRARLVACVHEAGHAILFYVFDDWVFDRVVIEKDNGSDGRLDNVRKKRQGTDHYETYVAGCVGGWAGVSAFFHNPPTFDDPQFKGDLESIILATPKGIEYEKVVKRLRTEAYGLLQHTYARELKDIAFNLFTHGELSYMEVQAIIERKFKAVPISLN